MEEFQNGEKREQAEKIVLYQLLQRHMEDLRQRTALLENSFFELETTSQALQSFGKIKENDALIHLGSGCYSSGRIAKPEKILVNVGANIIVKKDLKEAVAFLEHRKKEIQEVSKNIQIEIVATADKINKIGLEIQNAPQ